MIVERAGQDTLGVSTFLARPFTGVVVYLEATSDDRLSFYAPNVWMHQKRVLFPTFAILGSHLSNAEQADEVVRLLDAGALTTQPPTVESWEGLAEANQAIHENRHAGTITVRVGATGALDAARTARQVYEAWGSRFVDGKAVRVRIDPVRPGAPARVALVTIDVPPANALSATTLDDLERALDALEAEPDSVPRCSRAPARCSWRAPTSDSCVPSRVRRTSRRWRCAPRGCSVGSRGSGRR